MNRQTIQQQRAQPLPPGYRPPSAQSSVPPQPPGGMFYATAGQQATQQAGMGQGRLGMAVGGGSYGPMVGTIGRGGGAPPGFGGRTADSNDFPALGSHPHLSNAPSAYPNQTQQSQGGSQANPSHLQQHMFLQQSIGQGMSLPPPPGIGGHQATLSLAQPNGSVGDSLRGEDFPALTGGLGPDGKDGRMASYLRQNTNYQPPASPPLSIPNGASATHSDSATPSSNPPPLMSGAGGPPSTAGSSWARQTPPRPIEPVLRPVQQIMQSPVDKWGLKALLYEIKTSMGKGDRGILLFGEELEELGIDLTGGEPLYPTFVTPWTDPSQAGPWRIEEPYHTPTCYNVQAPSVTTKLTNFADDTLFYAFYSAPQDVLQLEIAGELYGRGWRYHTEMQVWLTSPTLPLLDSSQIGPESTPRPNWMRGPCAIFNLRTFAQTKTADDFMIDLSLLEVTRPAQLILGEEQLRKDAAKNGNGDATSIGAGPMSGMTSQGFQMQGQGLTAR